MEIIYVAHATTADNERGAATGWRDPGLSPRGRLQAAELRVLTEGLDPAVLVSSDLKRAEETARLAFSGRVEIRTDRRLRECDYGDWTGRPTVEVEAGALRHVSQPFPGGESYEDVERRVLSLLRWCLGRWPGERVALVSHRAPQLALEVILRGLSWQRAIASDWRASGAWQPGWRYAADAAVLARRADAIRHLSDISGRQAGGATVRSEGESSGRTAGGRHDERLPGSA